jgi:hypothetical protein
LDNSRKRNAKRHAHGECPPEVNISQILKNDTAVSKNLSRLSQLYDGSLLGKRKNFASIPCPAYNDDALQQL